MFIKLGRNIHQRMRLNLPSSKPSRSSARGTVLQAPARGTARRTPRRVLPRSHRYLRHTQSTHNKEKEIKKKIKVLSSSPNQRKLRYGDRNNIFGRFSNGTAESILEMAWSSFGRIGGFLAHEMIS